MKASERHLDLLELDAVRAGEAGREEVAHTESCDSCRTSLAGLQRMQDALRPRAVRIPPSTDRAVLSRKARPKLHPAWLVVSAAAVLLISLLVVRTLDQPEREPSESELPASNSSTLPADTDRNGVVDIVDAYVLAARIKSGQELEGRWDVNGDGIVDEEDVNSIARTSVFLNGRTD